MKTIWRITRIIGLSMLGLAFVLLKVSDYTVLDLPNPPPPGRSPNQRTPRLRSTATEPTPGCGSSAS